MAKQYYALTKILHGEGAAGEQEFKPGDLVTGLSKDAMVALWQAGALEERDPDARPKDDRDERIKELEAQLEDLKREQAVAALETAPEVPEGPTTEDEVPAAEDEVPATTEPDETSATAGEMPSDTGGGTNE
jgi:hypothetical protein